MALSGSTVWEIRTAGSDTNGGGFVAGASGTDFSQQNSKNTVGSNISTTDAVANGTTTITSATAAFTSAIVGNIVFFSGGSGSIAAQWRQVTAFTNSTTITIDATIASSTGLTMNIGGAMASLGAVAAVMVASNTVWVKAGTYTVTSASAVSGGCWSGGSKSTYMLAGYNTSRGDNPTGTNRPLLQASGISAFTLISMGSGSSYVLANMQVDGASLTSARGINSPGSNTVVVNCSAVNCTNSGIIAQSARRCVVTGCATTGNAFSITASASDCTAYANTVSAFAASGAALVRCIAAANTGTTSIGFTAPVSANNCVAYGNGSHGFFFNVGFSAENCIAVGNGASSGTGVGYDITANGGLYNCADFNNAGGRTNATPVLGDNSPISLSADPFTNAAGNDFSLNNSAGAGAACRATGYPGVLDVGGTGYLDVGALQHQDSGGGSTTHANVF